MKIMKPATTALPTAAAVPAAHPMVATTGAQPGQWVPPYGQPGHATTRAEVDQERVQAEQDGQRHDRNSTRYAH